MPVSKKAMMKVSQSGQVSMIADRVGNLALTLPNFASYDAEGNLYVSNSSTGDINNVRTEMSTPAPNGALVCIRANGKGEIVATGIYLANGTAAGVGGAAAQATRFLNPADIYVDKLFRPDTAAQPASTPASSPAAGDPNPAAPSGANPTQSRAEVLRLWTASFHDNQDLGTADKTYVARVVAARTGMSQTDAEGRVNDVITEAKTAADTARKAAAKLSFWLTAAMLFGAFAASLAAVEGGALRDGTWNDRVLTPRPI